ncbi:divalent metal cation transporter, partial [Burkholderia gladioli]
MKRGSPTREPGERAAGEPAAPGKPRPWYRRLGPGLLAGSADDDPGGIAVYSQAGSQFGFQMLWLIALALPLMVAVQIASARIGRGACA